MVCLELGLLSCFPSPSPALASFKTLCPSPVGLRLQPCYSNAFHGLGFSWYESQAIWARFCLTTSQTARCQLSSSSQAVQSAQLLLQMIKYKHGLKYQIQNGDCFFFPCLLSLLSNWLVAGLLLMSLYNRGLELINSSAGSLSSSWKGTSDQDLALMPSVMLRRRMLLSTSSLWTIESQHTGGFLSKWPQHKKTSELIS